MQLTKKKIILFSFIVLICLILLLSVIYHQTALWKPEQSLISLLPEAPICYLTIKDLEALVKTFQRSELGKKSTEMPIIEYTKQQLWWKQLVYQKLVWEYEMGGRLDMKAVKGHFGTEAILAFYQREDELSFILITELGGTEKLAIEAITATDAINPRYKRIQTEYNGLTINTIIGYPLDFSYVFIGKIGILSLNPLLLAEIIDIYGGNRDGYLVGHKKKEQVEESYEYDKSTGYIDISLLTEVLNKLEINVGLPFAQSLLMSDKENYWTIGNRYKDGVIISQHHIGNSERIDTNQLEAGEKRKFLPEQTALVTFIPNYHWSKLWKSFNEGSKIQDASKNNEYSFISDRELTVALITHNEGEVSKIPSIILHTPIQQKEEFTAELSKLKDMNIIVAGKPIEFLEEQEYSGISVQPIRLRLNILMSFVGGYAVVNNHFFFSTTLNGLKSILDVYLGDTAALDGVTFSDKVVKTYIQPNLLVPEMRRFIPVVTLLSSLFGVKIDANLMQHIKDNLFPLESLGPITLDMFYDESSLNADIRIVLEK